MNLLKTLPPILLHSVMLALVTTALHAQTPSAAGADSLIDPKDALVGIPRDVLRDLKPGSAKTAAAIAIADKQARNNITEKLGSFQFKVKKTEPLNGAYAITSVSDEVRVGGTQIPFEYTVMLDPSQNSLVGKIKPGDKVKASGKAFASYLAGSKPILRLELYKAVLK